MSTTGAFVMTTTKFVLWEVIALKLWFPAWFVYSSMILIIIGFWLFWDWLWFVAIRKFGWLWSKKSMGLCNMYMWMEVCKETSNFYETSCLILWEPFQIQINEPKNL